MKFAKLFEFPQHDNQLLVTTDFSNEDDSSTITFRIGHPFINAQITMGYDDEDKRNEEFEGIDDEKALNMFNSLKKQLEDLTNPDKTDKV